MDRFTVKRTRARERIKPGLVAATACLALAAALEGAPPQVPSITRAAQPSDAQPSSAEPVRSPGSTWTDSFASEQYGYSIRYPEGWTPGRLELPPNSDTFSALAPSRTRLSIVRRPKPLKLSLQDIADGAFQPHAGPNGCQWNTGGFILVPVAQGSFEGAVIDGRPALVRSQCGFVDAVIDAGNEVVIVVLRSGTPKPTGDDWWFARFMETIDIAVD